MRTQFRLRTARRAVGLVGALVIGATPLTGCGSGTGAGAPGASETAPLTEGMTEPPVRASGINTGEVVTLYRGQELHCLEGFKGRTNEGAVLSCDYVRFYAEHPDLLSAPSSTSSAPRP